MKFSDRQNLEEARLSVRLAELQPIGRGSHRICYPHPAHPDRCIKILIANLPSGTSVPGIVARSVQTAESPDENKLEYETYQELAQRDDSAVWRHIPRCHGWVATDLGPGLVTDFIHAGNGQPAESLGQRLDRSYDASCQGALAELKRFLLQHLIRIGDLHPSNLLICLPVGAENERLFIIDGLADRHFLWWSCFHFLRRFKVRRKIRRLERRIGWHLARQQAAAAPGDLHAAD